MVWGFAMVAFLPKTLIEAEILILLKCLIEDISATLANFFVICWLFFDLFTAFIFLHYFLFSIFAVHFPKTPIFQTVSGKLDSDVKFSKEIETAFPKSFTIG